MYKGEEFQTIQEVVDYWKEHIEKETNGMPEHDPYDIIGHILHVVINDKDQEWSRLYPKYEAITANASNIDIHNGDKQELFNDWQEIKNLVQELDREVHSK